MNSTILKTDVKRIVLLLRVPGKSLFIPVCPWFYATFVITFECLKTWISFSSAFQAHKCSRDEQRWAFIKAQALRLWDHLQRSRNLFLESWGFQMLALLLRTSRRNNSLSLRTEGLRWGMSWVRCHEILWQLRGVFLFFPSPSLITFSLFLP